MNLKIGTIIRKLRAENNITQDALATAIGVTPQAISRWESESGYPLKNHSRRTVGGTGHILSKAQWSADSRLFF